MSWIMRNYVGESYITKPKSILSLVFEEDGKRFLCISGLSSISSLPWERMLTLPRKVKTEDKAI